MLPQGKLQGRCGPQVLLHAGAGLQQVIGNALPHMTDCPHFVTLQTCQSSPTTSDPRISQALPIEHLPPKIDDCENLQKLKSYLASLGMQSPEVLQAMKLNAVRQAFIDTAHQFGGVPLGTLEELDTVQLLRQAEVLGNDAMQQLKSALREYGEQEENGTAATIQVSVYLVSQPRPACHALIPCNSSASATCITYIPPFILRISLQIPTEGQQNVSP